MVKLKNTNDDIHSIKKAMGANVTSGYPFMSDEKQLVT